MLDYGFYNSLNGDRRYNAMQMGELFEGLITDGVYPSVGEFFAVTPGTGLQILVGTGRAWFESTWSRNKSRYPMDLDISDPVFNRIDTVCLKVDKNEGVRANSLTILKGTISTNPAPVPLPTEDNVYYHPLAYVTVKPAAKTISSGDIQILVGTSACPFVTSILQQTNIDALFANWTDQFMAWWDGLRIILDEDAVGNLVNALDKKVNVEDMATAEDIGTSSSKWASVDFINALFPKGIIVAWSGSSSNIPKGWALCNGTNGTPNLVGRFIYGGTSSGATGGSSTVTLGAGNIPAHSHTSTIRYATEGSGSALASYSGFVLNPGGDVTGGSIVIRNIMTPDATYKSKGSWATSIVGSIASNTAYSTFPTPVSTIPPYYTLCYIMKL